MCGIAGIAAGGALALDSDRILRSLSHRGPDDQGGYESPGARLLHTRLSIIDLSQDARQPMTDGRFTIVYNGEIYNYLELRAELEKLGHKFRSRSDTEVLLAAYRQWGPQALPRLVGMFAFAILDSRDRRLFLARDCFGIKPLYYSATNGFAFASEIKPLLDLGAGRAVNPDRLHLYLRYALTDQGGETMFADIRQLPPAHYLTVPLDKPQEIALKQYWQIDLTQHADLSFEEAAKRLRELFLENIRLHLRSDVPVGAALSGGIDSSSITMAMRHLIGKDLDLHTFSYIADEPEINEERWVDLIGRQARAHVHKTGATPEELVADLDRLIDIQGEPFGSTSIYAQYRVFRLAREAGIKVMLDGQGADELLGGYRSYIAPRLASLIRQGQWGDAYRFAFTAGKLPGIGPWSLWRRALSFVIPRKGPAPAWINSDWFRKRGVVQPRRARRYKEVLRHELYRTLVETSLPPLLRYEDRNSMAFSIESRVPFLTPALVSFVFSLPENYIVAPDGTSKAVFRKAMRGIVPDEILDRKDKIGFNTPELRWLKVMKPWVERVLAEGSPALNMKEARKEWSLIQSGRKPFDFRVWRWISLIEWTKRFNVRFE